jgi:hypothetical protein
MTKIAAVAQELRELGVPASVIKTVRESAKNDPTAPPIGKDVQNRLRAQIGETKGAYITLSSTGGYRVFSPEGHASLRASAKKHQPWKLALAATSKTKH